MPTKEIVTEPTVKHTPILGPLVAIDLTIATAGTPDRPTIAVARVLTQAESDAITCREDEDGYARLFAAAPDLLQALREVDGDCYALNGVALGPRCVFCLMAEGEPHDPDCTMNFVLAAIAKAEGR